MIDTGPGSPGLDTLDGGQTSSFVPGAEPAPNVSDIVPFAGIQQKTSKAEAAYPGFTVLLVEDDDDLRHVMEAILAMTGYAVFSCADAQLASEAFRSRIDVGLLLTDLQMPGRSGVELARELTALRSSLPVMIVSGSVISADLAREIQTRNWKFLSKPFDIPAFLEGIHQLLRPRHEAAA